MTFSDMRDGIANALKTNTMRFKGRDKKTKNGETKKKIQNWALRSRSPPRAPNIRLPKSDQLLTEQYINDLFVGEARIHFLPQKL